MTQKTSQDLSPSLLFHHESFKEVILITIPDSNSYDLINISLLSNESIWAVLTIYDLLTRKKRVLRQQVKDRFQTHTGDDVVRPTVELHNLSNLLQKGISEKLT